MFGLIHSDLTKQTISVSLQEVFCCTSFVTHTSCGEGIITTIMIITTTVIINSNSSSDDDNNSNIINIGFLTTNTDEM